MTRFNWIVTAHNSEALIERVLNGIDKCAVGDSDIIVVADGCTDRTKELVEQWSRTHGFVLRIVETPDVHELLSINVGLIHADQSGDGYNVILQDDVILQDPDLEQHIEQLYSTIPDLGYVSLRLGFNLGSPHLTAAGYFEQVDEIESAYGAGVCGDYLMPGMFAYRTVPIKSPVVMPCKLVREIRILDPELAPYGYDDLDYAIRSMQAGYRNGVFSVPFISELEWGGTRKPGHPDVQPVVRRNAKHLAHKWYRELEVMMGERRDRTPVRIFDTTATQDAQAVVQWQRSQRKLAEVNR